MTKLSMNPNPIIGIASSNREYTVASFWVSALRSRERSFFRSSHIEVNNLRLIIIPIILTPCLHNISILKKKLLKISLFSLLSLSPLTERFCKKPKMGKRRNAETEFFYSGRELRLRERERERILEKNKSLIKSSVIYRVSFHPSIHILIHKERQRITTSSKT